MSPAITKAVFPVAALGNWRSASRDPLARLSELRPIVDKPIIQFAIDEARAAGIEELIFVTCSEKAELENHLTERWPANDELVTAARLTTVSSGEAIFIRQPKQRGIGHAVLLARELLGEQPFAVIIPNLLVLGQRTPLSEMVEVYQPGSALIGTVEKSDAEVQRFGVLKFDPEGTDGGVTQVVEKPTPENAPSRWVAFGRWILPPEALDSLAELSEGQESGEIALTDCINRLTEKLPVTSTPITGTCYDLRDSKQLVKATVAYALDNPTTSSAVTEAFDDYVDAGVSTIRSVALSRRYEILTSMALLTQLIERDFSGEIALVSSFGSDSAVLLHMISRVDPDTPVLFMNTGRLFKETLDFQEELSERLGLRNLQVVRPLESDLKRFDADRTLFSRDPDMCCNIRKTLPMERALTPFKAWITGRKRYQSAVRAKLPLFEEDSYGRVKVNPLMNWTREDVKDYLKRHDLPAHPLIAEGFLSIGCEPCTSPVKDGEDERAGRWRGTEKTECGIHFVDGKVVRNSKE